MGRQCPASFPSSVAPLRGMRPRLAAPGSPSRWTDNEGRATYRAHNYIAAPRERCFDLARSVVLRPHLLANVRSPVVRAARLHGHYFAEDGRGGTVMRDLFDFAAPFGVLGWVAERLILTRYLRRFLEARNREIKVVAESDAWRQFVPT